MMESFKHLLDKPEFSVSSDPQNDTNYNPLEKEERWEAEDIEEHDAVGPPNPEDSADSESSPEEAALPTAPLHLPERKSGAWPRVVAGVAACVGVACLGLYWYASSNDPLPADIPKGDILASLAAAPTSDPSANPSPQQKAAEAPRQQKAAADIPVKPALSPAPTSAPAPQAAAAEGAAKQPSTGAFGANPFIDLSTLHAAANALSASGLPPIHGNGNRALPEVPRPEVSPELLPSPGEIRTPPSPVGASDNAATMGGLIRKPNGEAVAIMGDGTVLSEGDTYKGDRRVTFIGGDGVTFDDGNTVPFGQNK